MSKPAILSTPIGTSVPWSGDPRSGNHPAAHLMIHAVGYMRTSSAANVGEDKDSDKRQRLAIEGYARRAGYEIAEGDWLYDAAVRGEDIVTGRPGFVAMMERIADNGVRTVIIEDAGRFARDLIVQLTGH